MGGGHPRQRASPLAVPETGGAHVAVAQRAGAVESRVRWNRSSPLVGDACPGVEVGVLVLLVSRETLGVSSEERHDSDLHGKGSRWPLCRDER